VQIVDISKVQYIHNTTRNISLYDYSISSPLVSLGNNVVIVPTNCNGMLYTDTLDITYDFDVSSSIPSDRQILEFPAPTSGSTIYVVANKRETIVSFKDKIIAPFTISLGSVGNLKGDKLYLMGRGDSEYTIPLLGVFNNILCGATQSNWVVNSNYKVLEFIFDGTYFTGIDNC
jgi:hypothetical protein